LHQGRQPEDETSADGEIPLPEEVGPKLKARSMFRLWRFARAHVLQILLGFVLTLATTAAGLVPPYLTMPLLDEILIPYQNQVEGIRQQTENDPAAQEARLAELKAAEADRFGR